jgi:hypothetical protein
VGGGPNGGELGALVAGLRAERAAIGRRFAQLLRAAAPEYYAIDASDFQDAGWAALAVVVDGALLAVDEGSHAGFPVELVAESVAAARNGLRGRYWTAATTSPTRPCGRR